MDRRLNQPEPYSALEEALMRALREVKKELASVNESYMNFAIHANGRIDGDLNVVFRIGYSSDPVSCEGGRLSPVIHEYVRRFDWKRFNAPLCLPNVDTSQDRRIDEIIDELEDEKHNG